MKLLILDFNNILYRGFSVTPDLTFCGKSTGGVYGFINQFSKHVNVHTPDYVLVCGDSRPYKRKELAPEYKSDRVKASPETYEKINQNARYAKDFLSLLNVTCWEEPGQEADDLIASACEFSNGMEIVIVSNDNDLFQLLKYGSVKLQRSKELYTREDFDKEYGIPVEDWIRVTALAGGHNGFDGLDKVGIKTALKIVKKPELWEKIYADNKKLLDLYMKLAKLPFDDFDKTISISKAKYNERAMIKFMSYLGIDLTPAMRKAFVSIGG